MARNPFAYEVDYDREIAAAEVALAEVEKALSNGWTYEGLWPGIDLEADKHGTTYLAVLEEIPEFAQALGLTDEAIEALAFYTKHCPARGQDLNAYQRSWMTSEQRAHWIKGRNLHEDLVSSHVNTEKAMKARRTHLKSSIARWKRNKAKHGGA